MKENEAKTSNFPAKLRLHSTLSGFMKPRIRIKYASSTGISPEIILQKRKKNWINSFLEVTKD